jgi:hypothetical protein
MVSKQVQSVYRQIYSILYITVKEQGSMTRNHGFTEMEDEKKVRSYMECRNNRPLQR